MKYLTILISLFLLLLISCNHKSSQTNIQIIKKDTDVNIAVKLLPTTDSGKLMLHLDSLPKIKFPFKSEAYNREFDSIDLSEFKNKKLFNLSFTRIPTTIGGGGLDDERVDSTFNLVEKNYKGAWNLIVKKPKFIVVEIQSIYFNGVKLVTLTYNLEVIDAINIAIADPSGHYPWFADRHSIINQNLTLILQHEYIMNETENSAETETSHEKWFIDKTGHFKKSKNQ